MPVINDSILFIIQYRIAVQQYMLEIPAGRLEPNEQPRTSALRELKEEVGYTTKDLTLLTEYYTAAGFSTERMFIYLATNLIETVKRLDVVNRLERSIDVLGYITNRLK